MHIPIILKWANIRLLDSINRPEDLVKRAIELDLAGVCITDHECLSSHVELDRLINKYKEIKPSFKIGRGNEIYLVNERKPGQKYWHYILVACDAIGHKMLRELSSTAWINSYFDRGMERVPTLKSELEEIVSKYGQGHLISSTACLGSELDSLILELCKARKIGDSATEEETYQKIISFLSWNKQLFGDNFYLEVQPARSKEQMTVNRMMGSIGAASGIKVIVTTDAHYLKKEDRWVHKAFLNSKGGEREVDEFYEYTYLQSTEEVINNLESTGLDYNELEANTLEIYNKIQDYSLARNQHVTEVKVKNYPKKKKSSKYKVLNSLYDSDNPQERYWVNYCVDKLKEKDLFNDEYLSRLEYEADIKKAVGEKLGTCIFAYPNFLQHYINLFWECGSPVGAGRGCFLPNKNYVTMSNGKTKLIEDVQIGDYVKTIDGTSQKVMDTLSYDCNEEVYKVTVNGNGGFDLYNTNNHQYWAMKNKKCPYDRAYCSMVCRRRKTCPHKQGYKKEWVRTDNLSVGDYVFHPWYQFDNQKVHRFDLAKYCIGKESHFTVCNDTIYNRTSQKTFCRYIDVNEEFLYLIGVCIGDGWTIIESGGTVGIAFNSSTRKDTKSLERCETYLHSLGLGTKRIKHKQKNLIQLYCYNLPFALFIRELIGRGVENKQIPNFLLYDNRAHMIALLSGLIASDGSYDKESPCFSYDGINFNLVNQIRMLCSYLHFYTSITTRKAHSSNKESYKIRACGGEIKEFLEKFSPHEYKNIRKTVNNVIIDDDGYWTKITKIEKTKYNGKVYDLTVENNHNYIVNNVSVHNSAGAGLNHYLLGITQTDPIKTNAPFFRYMNKDRVELPDIDLDLSPSKREYIFEKIREERGELGCVQVCTFGTATTKSAIQIACRGYRTEQCKDGIDNDTALYLSSLVPSERGFLWPISDVINGNKEKDRRPNKIFINAINQYPGLLDIIVGIEGLIVSRGIHASGVIFYGDDPYDTACFMKATNGAIITQYSLHDAEYCGDVKYDMLLTQQMDIMTQCIKLLQENGYIEKDLTLRQAYDKYVHPDKLPLEDDKLWDAIDSTEILALFQLNTAVGGNIVRQLQPRNVEELTACNALMRLAGEPGMERPADRYERLKNNINLWYEEMDNVGLTKDEQHVLEKHMLADYGAPSSQEVLMTILMDKDTCGFTLAEANAARKIIAKKQMDKVNKLKEKVLSQAKRKVLGEYIWHTVIMPQASYSFSRIHGYSYSLIACQAAYLATYFPSIYWNTAYLRVISGLDIDASSNYNKIAKGVGDILKHGINVSLVDINKSGYMFEPDEEHNAIRYGLKAVTGVGGEIIEEIIKNRPYDDIYHFMEKVKCNKTVMVALIKSGAFDEMDERSNIMKEYLSLTSNPKKRITMQNFNMLNEKGLLPQELNFQKRLFIFNKALKKNCKSGSDFIIKDNYYDFYEEFFDTDILRPRGDCLLISAAEWKEQYDRGMAPAKKWITANKEMLLKQLNDKLFQEEWDKYAAGNYSSWEMESLGFYYHDHELKNVNDSDYGIVEFDDLSETPVVDYTFTKNNRQIPIFKTYRLCGTVIAKDDARSSISILTKRSGVVNVKMTRDYYSRLNKQISEVGIDGKKHVIEKGFFKRGTLVVVNGFRRSNMFVLKSYKRTNSHQFYKITKVNEDGTINMTHLRADEVE